MWTCEKCGYTTNSDRMMKLHRKEAVHECLERQKLMVADVEPEVDDYYKGNGWYEYDGKSYRRDDLITLLAGDTDAE